MQDAETVIWTPTTAAPGSYGDTTYDAGTEVPLQALVAIRTTSENDDQSAAGVFLTKSLFILGTAAVPTAADSIVVRGDVFQVVGEAHRWGDQGVEVLIQRTAPQ